MFDPSLCGGLPARLRLQGGFLVLLLVAGTAGCAAGGGLFVAGTTGCAAGGGFFVTRAAGRTAGGGRFRVFFPKTKQIFQRHKNDLLYGNAPF